MPDSSLQEQGQSQTQIQMNQTQLQISVQSSGDVELERRIFSQTHSVGRQLGRLGAALDVLVDVVLQSGQPPLDPQQIEAIQRFRRMRSDIALERAVRSPERFIAELDKLRLSEPQRYEEVRTRLREWLDAPAKLAAPAPTPMPIDPGPAAPVFGQP